MEHFRRRSSAEGGVTFLERALNGLSTQRSKSPAFAEHSEPREDFKGPLGLNLLHAPSKPLVDLIFVHGLGGGSRKTWSKTTDPYHYWPKEWLPRDPAFQNVRIYSFGYVADWSEMKNSVLEINDFARSLLGEIKDNPEMRRNETRIVLVGHSMGGLVIKKAYILARQDPTFTDLASRFYAAYFLATPHRGADLARTLTNILKVTYGQKPYVNELEPNSGLVSGINDTFRHYAQDLQLWSFYETLQSNLLISNAMVVDKTSATLGYPHERTALLNADHRGMCKFNLPSDPNYKTLRNAFSTTVDAIVAEAFCIRQEADRSELRRLSSLVGISEPPQDDLQALSDARMAGSCGWLTSKTEFEEWRVSWSKSPSILWLSGNPTSGKSILSGHVINHLKAENLNCSYFFFKQGIATKSSVGDCLRSLAFQMALCHVEVRRRLLSLEADGMTIEKNDDRSIWRKLFSEAVFKATFQPHYWVIDALDECNQLQSFFSMVSSLDGHIPLRIFLTSRKTQEIERAFGQLGKDVAHLEILISDTLDDIRLFIAARMNQLPVEGSESRANLTNKILAKSNGSFLWVRLVLQELEHTWSEEGVEEVLNEIPADMNLLYMRTLEKMSKVNRTAKLAKAILTWIVCAARSLTLSEMQCALKLDINETVHNLERSITSICGQLVFVDQRSRVQMIHQTARDFLLRDDLDSEFAVRKAEGHTRLSIKCLELLSGNHIKAPRSHKQKLGFQSGLDIDSALVDYACTFFSDHLYKTSSLQSEPWDALYDFLSCNVLSWIERLARSGDLYYITRTAMNIKAYLERRAKYFPPIGQQTRTVEEWSVDLIRVSAKFRTNLLTSPASIYWLIPPMCPTDSIIAQKFTSPHRGLTIKGSVAKTWDDCLTQFDYPGSQATALNHGDRFFAVGLSTGKVMVYHSISYQVHRVLEHFERVKILEFGRQDKVLASSGLKNLRVWDLSSGEQIWSFDMSHQALTLAFTTENECLMAATQGDYVACWSLSDGGKNVKIPWQDGFRDGIGSTRQRQSPTHALFSPDRNLLAVSYRGRPILLFDVESEMFFGECVRKSNSGGTGADTHYPIVAITFNPNPDINLLVASYGDGELTVYNPWTLELVHRVSEVNAQSLACSPDGRTLITGSSFGTIQVFDFDAAGGERLALLYRISAYENGIKSLAFSNNSLRFIDIRGSQCRVWEPSVLARKNLQDCDQSEASDPIPMAHKSVEMVESQSKTKITTMVCHHDGDVVFCGKQDGSVMAFLTHDGQENSLLYKHASNISVTHIAWGSHQSVLVSADESSRIIIRKIIKDRTGLSAAETMSDKRFADSVSALLFDPTNNRLLVSGKKMAELWTIHGERMGSKTFLPRTFRMAICHPLRADIFVVMEPHLARLFTWADFETLAEEGVRLNRSSEPDDRTSTLTVFYQGTAIMVELLKPSGGQSSRALECWQMCDIRGNVTSITPLPGFEMLGSSVEHILTVIGTRLVFLDTDLWVCSLDLKSFAATPEAQRHFFIPSDWHSDSDNVLFQFTSKDEFIYANKNELRVIKRAMNYSETISLSKAQQWNFNHGRKLELISP